MRASYVLFFLLITSPLFLLAQQDPEPEPQPEDDDKTPTISFINDPTSVLNMNAEKEQTIGAFVFARNEVESVIWQLDPTVHKEDENKTFFEKVKANTTGDPQFTLVIPANAGFVNDQTKNREFTIQLLVKDKEGLNGNGTIKIGLKIPSVRVKMTVEPESGVGLRTEFTFKFNKQGDEPISYALSYMRHDRLVTISSAINVNNIPDVRYKFPVPYNERQQIIVTLAYATASGDDIDDSSVELSVTSPMVFDWKELDELVEQQERAGSGNVDLSLLTSLTHTIITMFYRHEYFHTGIHKVTCEDKSFCSGNGECINTHLYWKACKCQGSYTGPICATTRENDDHISRSFVRILRVIEKADNIDASNIGHMTETIKSMASIRPLHDEHLFKKIFTLTDKFLLKVGSSVNDKDVVEDIFISMENIIAAFTMKFFGDYTNNPKSNPGNVWANFQKVAREKIDQLINLIIRGRTGYDRWEHTMETGGISMFTTIPEKMTNIDSAELTITSGRGDKEETVLIKVPTELLKTVREGKKSLAITAYQAFHNPYEAIQVDTYTVNSPVVHLSLREKENANPVESLVSSQTYKDNPVFFTFPTFEGLDLKHIECAVWNEGKHFWQVFESGNAGKKKCNTVVTSQNQVVCYCTQFGDFALVLKNANPKPKVSDEVDDIKPIVDRNFRSSQLMVTGGFVLALWILTFVCSLREGSSNPIFSQQMTIHPIYSIMSVYTSNISRMVKVHLLFLTFAVQLAVSAYWIRAFDYELIPVSIVAILISIPFNYIFGMLAKVVSGGQSKQGRRGLMMILAEILLIVTLGIANFRIAAYRVDGSEVTDVWKAWGMAVAIDILALDTIMVIVGKIGFMTSILSLRGFYSKSEIDLAGYVQSAEIPFMK